jgi:hypothetical protein
MAGSLSLEWLGGRGITLLKESHDASASGFVCTFLKHAIAKGHRVRNRGFPPFYSTSLSIFAPNCDVVQVHALATCTVRMNANASQDCAAGAACHSRVY